MLEKLNILPIVRDHLSTLRVGGKNSISNEDVFVFFVIPAAISISVNAFGIKMPEKYVDFSLIAFSIVVPLLFNVLFLIHSIKRQRDCDDDLSAEEKRLREKAQKLLEAVYKNLSYTVLVSVVAVLALGATKMIGLPPLPFISANVLRVFSSVAVWTIYFSINFLMIHFGLTSLMIIKRTHILLGNEMESD